MIDGLWLRRVGTKVQMLVDMGKIDGVADWRLVIEEDLDGNFSHIVEPAGIARAKVDPISVMAPRLVRGDKVHE